MRSYKTIVEWFGGMAVVASLLLVAYEIRQNTNAVSAQAFYELNESFSVTLQHIFTDQNVARLWMEGDENPGSLDDLQWYQYKAGVWADINVYEAAFKFYEKGIIDEVEYRAYLSSYCVDKETPGYQRVLATIQTGHLSDFHSSVEHFCNGEN